MQYLVDGCQACWEDLGGEFSRGVVLLGLNAEVLGFVVVGESLRSLFWLAKFLDVFLKEVEVLGKYIPWFKMHFQFIDVGSYVMTAYFSCEGDLFHVE